MQIYKNEDFIGKKFGKLLIEDIFKNEKNIKTARCKCDCGNIVNKDFYGIKDGKITSCGNCNQEYVGKKFGKLLIKEYYFENNKSYFNCVCDCGNTIKILTSGFKKKRHMNCGKCDSQELIGKKYGKLLVIDTFYRRNKQGSNKLWCKCICDCGNSVNIRAQNMKDNSSHSCGKCRELELVGKKFGQLKVVDTFYKTNSRNKNDLWCKCICDCGKELDVIAKNLTRKKSPQISCGCIKTSKGQFLIENWLKNNNIFYTTEETFNKNDELRTGKWSYLRYDMYIPQKNIIIEYDGIQHFEPVKMWGGEKALKETQAHDKLKNQWAKEHGIQLVRFNYKHSNEYIKNNLQSLLL